MLASAQPRQLTRILHLFYQAAVLSDGPNAKRLFDLWDCLQEAGQCLRLPNARFEGDPSAQCLSKELPDLLKEELRRCVNGS